MSFFADAFSAPKPAKVEPLPTRDTAADSAAAEAEAERKRRLTLSGPGSVMLTGPGGVMTELTGTRSASGR